jgi:hypothetical protein
MNVFGRDDINRVLNARAKVVFLKVGIIIPENVIERESLSDQLQDVLHGNPRPGYTGLAKVDSGIDGNTAGHGLSSFAQLGLR